MSRLSVTMSREIMRGLRRLAKRYGVSVGSVIRHALVKYLSLAGEGGAASNELNDDKGDE